MTAPYTPAKTWRRILALHKQGFTTRMIAKETGHKPSKIEAGLRDMGLEPNKSFSQVKREREENGASPPKDGSLVDRIKAEVTYREICEMLGVKQDAKTGAYMVNGRYVTTQQILEIYRANQ